MTQPPAKPTPAAADKNAPSAPKPAEAPAPEAAPVEDKTKPYALADLADKLAKQRRRSTAAELIVKRPKQPEVRVPLDRTEMLIGRDPDCDLVLTEFAVSRRHAKVRRTSTGHYEVMDLGSQNGIRHNDMRIERMILLDGDAFVVGDTHLRIVVGTVLGADGSG